jgi:pimeloyl-ACP methyl ester carboxylesterase
LRIHLALSLLLAPAFFFSAPSRSQAQQVASSPNAEPTKPPTADDYRKFERFLEMIRARNAEHFAIKTKNGIDEASYVSIGGIEQWITIRGEDRANPVLLFLHGGPGDVTNPWSFAMFAPWEKYFTVVQWDERGAGRTFARNGDAIGPTMTVDRMIQDGIEVAQYARAHLQKRKIILLGHSFGSILAMRMISAKPELFYAYVGTGQVADSTKSYSVAYEALLKKAQVTGNQAALDDLRRIGPPPYKSGEGYRVQWWWANRFERADQFLTGGIGLTLVAPGGSVEDFNNSSEGEMLSGERLVPTIVTPKDLGLKFSIPVFFFQGAEDFTTPTELARHDLASINAPRKEFVALEGGGHFAMFMKSDDFLNILVKRVRPLALKG